MTRESSLRPESFEYSVSPMPTIAHLSLSVFIRFSIAFDLGRGLQDAAAAQVFDLLGGHAWANDPRISQVCSPAAGTLPKAPLVLENLMVRPGAMISC